MFKRILVAIDESKPAVSAIEVAAELALQLNGELAVCHVIDDAQAFRAELGIFDEALLEELRRDGAATLDAACRRVPPGLKPEPLLVEGEPSEKLIATAQQWGADLIVIGSDSRGRLAHFLLGSTADSVIRRAPCPVVAVRSNGKQAHAEAPGALAAGA